MLVRPLSNPECCPENFGNSTGLLEDLYLKIQPSKSSEILVYLSAQGLVPLYEILDESDINKYTF